MIRVLLVDDHALVRMGIRRLLDDMHDIEVIAEADDGEQALLLIKAHQPDVVLLDMKLPGIDGFEVTRRLSKIYPAIKIIAVTALRSDPLPSRILQLGAMGYLTKESGVEEMALAIRKVARGERYLSAEIAQKMAISSLQPTPESPMTLLSEREIQVFMMITNGLGVSEISEKLHLSGKTVNGYRYRIFDKLGVKNDVELTHFAIKHRVIENSLEAIEE